MQSILSVFRRPSQPPSNSNTTNHRRKSSSTVSPTTQTTTPRHLHLQPGSESEQQQQEQQSPAAAPATFTNQPQTLLQPPPPRSTSTSKAPLPPPPRSRQASSNSISTTRSFSGPPTTSNSALPTSSYSDYQTLFLAIYDPHSSGEVLPGESEYTLALHLSSPTIANNTSVRVYSIKGAATSPHEWTPTRDSISEVELASDRLLLGRVKLGYVPITNETDVQERIDHLLDNISTPAPQISTSTKVWFGEAINVLRANGLLVPTTPSTTSTAPTPPFEEKKTKTPRPSLLSHDTDNWNDIPDNFLSADAANALGGGSLGRRKVRGTPRVTPRGSVAEMRQSSVGSGPPQGEAKDKENEGEGAKKKKSKDLEVRKGMGWDDIVREVERWGGVLKREKERESGEANTATATATAGIRTLDLKTGSEC